MVLNCIDYAAVLMEEICLEGLDGITPETLWLRLSVRFGLEVLPPFRKKLWNLVLQLKFLKFYLLPETRPSVHLYDRYSNIDNRSNFLPVETDAHIYGYYPVKEDYGSCQFYNTRTDVSTTIHEFSYEDIWKWSNKLVVVGDVLHRWNALAPAVSFSVCETMTPTLYCVLERIGRSRSNGEITAGEDSLNKLESNSKTLAYYNKQLIFFNLVQKQHISIRSNNNSTTCVLLHLTRYYRKFTKYMTHFVERIEEYLKSCPEGTALLYKIKEALPQYEFSIKRIRASIEFAKKIKIDKIACNHQDSNKIGSKVKPCSHPDSWHMTFTLIKHVNDEKPEDCSVLRGSAIMRTGLLRQVHNIICESKSEGISFHNITKSLGAKNSSIRLAIKYLTRVNLLHVTIHDRKRQRIIKYMSKEFQLLSTASQDQPEAIKHDISGQNSNSNVCENTYMDIDLTNLPQIDDTPSSTQSSNLPSDFKSNSEEFYPNCVPSLKKTLRANLVMKFLSENHVTAYFHDIKKYIMACEKNNMEYGTIDHRSMRRLIFQMERENFLKVIRVRLSMEANSTILYFICEKSIDTQHAYIKHTIEQKKYEIRLQKSKSLVDNKHINQLWSSRKNTSGNPFPYLRKFGRMRVFHEYLHYLAYGHKNKVTELPEETQNLLQSEQIFSDTPMLAFEDVLEKCMFVTPLADRGFAQGWVLLSDAIERLPLCLLSNLIYININIPGISNYFKDSIKCQIPMINLPGSIQHYIMYKGRYKFFLHKIVEQLCLIGLIQFGEQVMKDKDKVYIYVNKNAILWDTTSSRPGYHKVEDKEYPRENFKLKSVQDIKHYWNRMLLICNNTPLGQRYAALGEQVESVQPEIKMAYALKIIGYEEAKNADTGYIPGDGLGAAGFDSMIFSHLKRSWTANLIVSDHKKEKGIIIKKKQGVSRGDKHILPPVSTSQKKIRTIKPRKPILVRYPKNDEVDKMIIEKYGRRRSTWKNTEDQLLFIFKIAFHIIYPPRFFINFHIIRDFMHKTVSPPWKTSSTYRRRMLFLMNKPENFRQVEIYLTEFRRKEVINNKYCNLYNRLKKEIYKKKPLAELDNDCRIRLVELVNLLYKKFVEKNVQNQVSIVLPRTLADLHKEYDIEVPSLYNFKLNESSLDKKSEIKVNILKSVIHSALSCSLGKQNAYFSLFDTYKHFPEGMLRSTIVFLRSTGMISLNRYEVQADNNRKIIKKSSTNASHYKLSQSYFIQVITKLLSTIYSQAFKYLKGFELGSQIEDAEKSLTGGGIAALFDLMLLNFVNINVTTSSSSADTSMKNIFSKSKELSSSENTTLSRRSIENPYVITGYGWNISVLDNWRSDIICSSDNVNCITEYILQDSLLPLNEENASNSLCVDDFIIKNECIFNDVFEFISTKCEIGASQDELKEKYVVSQIITLEQLNIILTELKNRKMVRRLGNGTWQWVSQKYWTFWCIKTVPSIKENKTVSNSQIDPEIKNIAISNEDNENKSTEIDISIFKSNETMCNDDVGENLKLVGKKRKYSSHDETVVPKKHCPDNLSSNDECMILVNESEKDLVVSKKEIDMQDNSININYLNNEIQRNSNIADNKTQEGIEKSPENQNGTGLLNSVNDSIMNIDPPCSESTSNTKFYTHEKDGFIFPRPWIRPNGTLNCASFFHWTAAILNHLLLHPLVKLVTLHERFNFLQFHELQILIEIMEKIGCVKMKHIVMKKKPSLFNKNTALDLTIEIPTGLENRDELFVEVLEAAVIKYATFRGRILDSSQ